MPIKIKSFVSVSGSDSSSGSELRHNVHHLNCSQMVKLHAPIYFKASKFVIVHRINLKMMFDSLKKNDVKLASIFFISTIFFIILSMSNEAFFNWMFERHQNILSWYIRPIFLIPFCFFAYKRTWFGISLTIFCLFTSMCWFNKPDVVSEEAKLFLQFEQEWLYGQWDYKKWLLILTVPISFTALGLAFWKRSLWMGLGVVILMATGKIIWSIQNAGEAGQSILLPAVIGLLICLVLIYIGFKRLENNSTRS